MSLAEFLRGSGLVLFIVALAGGIAYIGDRVGHQVGRRRLTLFGLRPRYTSTIVAVSTGMLIALTVVLVAIFASEYVKTAFFRLGEVNNRINQLQAQADSLSRELGTTRTEQLLVQRGQPLYPPLIIQQTQTESERFSALQAYFDEVIDNVNRTFVPAGLRPYPKRAHDPENEKKLHEELTQVDALILISPVLIVPLADNNLFRNDEVHFGFTNVPDRLLYHEGDTIASIEVVGNSQVDLTRLIFLAQNQAIAKGMPPSYVSIPGINYPKVATIQQQVQHGRGRFRVIAKAAQDIYPHLGALPLDFAVARAGSK